VSWLRKRRERAARIAADAKILIRALGNDAYAEARLMQNQAKSTEERRRWRDAALIIADMTGRRIGLDTATRMSRGADSASAVCRRRGGVILRLSPPIDELMRRIGTRGGKQ
jgi:hypothetical protein